MSSNMSMIPPNPAYLRIPPNLRYLFDRLLYVDNGCPNLQEFYSRQNLDMGISPILALLPHLSHFRPGNTMRDKDLEALSLINPLQNLDLSDSLHLTDVSLTFIYVNSLTFLDLSSCFVISDLSLKLLPMGHVRLP